MSWKIVPGASGVSLVGDLRIADAAQIWDALRYQPKRSRFDLDLTHATSVDGAVLALLVELRARMVSRGIDADIVGVPEAMRPLVHLYHGDEPAGPLPRPPARIDPVTQLGMLIANAFAGARRAIALIGELLVSLGHRDFRGRNVARLVSRSGTDGLPIVLVLNFLVGFVMAYQSTRQLQSYGANLYVADVVGIAMARELAPLITATIITGRSGAAFAAELGTMRVSEEIDALRTIGFSPTSYLVVPRLVALVIVAPILTLLGDVAGTIGGLVVGATSLDIHPHSYLTELREALEASDVWTGLIKSVAFGIAIAIIGCQQGLATSGAASGVGRSTTKTVVYCLFALVIIDTALTVVFRSFDV